MIIYYILSIYSFRDTQDRGWKEGPVYRKKDRTLDGQDNENVNKKEG